MKALLVFVVVVTVTGATSTPSAVRLVQDIFTECVRNFKISNCVEPRARSWADQAAQDNVIEITEDLVLVKKFGRRSDGEGKGFGDGILDKFEDFLQSYDVVAKLPSALDPSGPFAEYIPRNFVPKELTAPLASTGRSSKIVKKLIFPFLLGLKFKTAVLVPLALALIALQSWKGLTLALLSLVLTGAIAIFSKFVSKPPTYEVIHYPQHFDHVDVIPASPIPAPAVHYGHPYARAFGGQELAYKSSLE